MKEAWYESWFDSPFYHILYKNRDEREAELFMRNLLDYLSPNPGARILDMPCGKGRHARFLASFGYQVMGIDLSPRSIEEARKEAPKNASFKVHDMREPLEVDRFQYVFNLFTSFGYFDSTEENLKVLMAANQNLVPGGYLVIDFLNSFRTAGNLKPKEHKVVDGIRFNIERKLQQGKILKTIAFKHQGEDYEFEERVQALSMKDFKILLKGSGFSIVDHFGDYNLNYYHANTSERLIIIACKN